MQHIINLKDFKDFTFETTIAGSTDDNKRLDYAGFINDGEVANYFRVYENKDLVHISKNLKTAIERYNSIKG